MNRSPLSLRRFLRRFARAIRCGRRGREDGGAIGYADATEKPNMGGMSLESLPRVSKQQIGIIDGKARRFQALQDGYHQRSPCRSEGIVQLLG